MPVFPPDYSKRVQIMAPKSRAELAVGPIIPGARLPPPADLEPEEQGHWLMITGALPSDWFGPENTPLLRELCRHIAYADWLAQDITRLRRKLAELAELGDPKQLRQAEAAMSRTLRLHGRQSEHIGNVSTKLRLTKLSRYGRADAAGSATRDAAPYPKPWTDWRS
jgi:hypothetical protein